MTCEIGNCPICNDKSGDYTEGEVILLKCKICGDYKIAQEDLEDIDSIISPEEKYLVSGFTRSLTIKKSKPPVLTRENLKDIAERAPKSVLDKIDHLLLNLSEMSSHPGETLKINPDCDYPLGYCSNSDEFNFYLRHLDSANLFRDRMLTVKGWEKVTELARTAIASSQVFIAMNFDKELDFCYENGIKTALDETKYKPYRIDREEHADKIDDKILSEIKRSKFIIAEFTGQKHGVYFEAGYALGLGIPVIWTCKEDDVKNLHFDTRQYNHIVWKDENDLKERLINRIRVVIGDNK